MQALWPTILSSLISALLAWLIARRKQNAETVKLEAEAVKLWIGVANELGAQVKSLHEECGKLRTEIYTLRQDNHTLSQEIHNLKNKSNV